MKVKLEEIMMLMSEKGLRVTEQRRTLAKIFVEHDGYLTPKEVYEQMGRFYTGLSFDTVYRNLRLLHEMNVLEQFVFENEMKFKVRCGEDDHHHHLICMDCEKTVPLVYCPMDHIPGVPQDFDIVKHKFEVYGYCKECRESSS